MANVKYLARCFGNFFSGDRYKCPNCESNASTLIERKYVVSSLRRCNSCLMMFRTPNDTQTESNDFYNESYTQGFTTEMPSNAQLSDLLSRNFANSEKDYTRYIALLAATGVKPPAKIFDFGCSWGYGSYQFKRAGFDVTSSEVSAPRGRYAEEKLGVTLVDFDTAVEQGKGQYDVFFSSHVLEHVPSPSAVIEKGMSMLKPQGLFIAFFPNGSAYCRAADPNWSKYWGEVHPNLIDEVFLNRAFKTNPRLYASEAYDQTKHYSRADSEDFAAFKQAVAPSAIYADDLNGFEMYFASRK